MTGITIRGRPFEHTVGMALLTCHTRVRTVERKTRFAVVKSGILPIAGVVTSGTDRAELSLMGIIGGVTSRALPRCAFVSAVRMAGGTRHAAVRAGKREARAAVIEIHLLPSGGSMAGSAIRAELSIMAVIG